MVHVHHFLCGKNLLSAIFDRIGTARRSILNVLVAVFDMQSYEGDHLGGVDGIFQRKRRKKIILWTSKILVTSF